MDDNELQSKLFMSDKKITKGSLQGFRLPSPSGPTWNLQLRQPAEPGFLQADAVVCHGPDRTCKPDD
jgi:hypothetical protein